MDSNYTRNLWASVALLTRFRHFSSSLIKMELCCWHWKLEVQETCLSSTEKANSCGRVPLVWTNRTNERDMASTPCPFWTDLGIGSTITTNRKGRLVGIATDWHLWQSQGRCFCTSANNLIIKMRGLESMTSDDNPGNISILEMC